MKIRKVLKTSTCNVRTLLNKGQIYQLIKGSKENDLDIIATQHSYAYAPAESAQLGSKDGFYAELHIAISLILSHNFVIVLRDFIARIGQIFIMILPHKLLANTHITKTPTITTNDLLAFVRTANLYLLSIINHIKITTCGLGNTLMAFIEHRLTIFY